MTTLRRLHAAAGREGHRLYNVLRLLAEPDSIPMLPEIAGRVARIGFDELIVEPVWENVGEARGLLRAMRAALCSGPAGA